MGDLEKLCLNWRNCEIKLWNHIEWIPLNFENLKKYLENLGEKTNLRKIYEGLWPNLCKICQVSFWVKFVKIWRKILGKVCENEEEFMKIVYNFQIF